MKKIFRNFMALAITAMTFAACQDVPEPYDIPGTGTNVPGTSTEIEGGTGTGTLDDPFNAIAALNYGKKLASGEESADYYYVKGKVVSVKEEFTTQYGNGTFYISEDGTAANQFYAYRVLYMGNKKFAAGDTQIKVGDEVIVCGKITNYNGTVETAQNKGFLYALNGEDRGGEPQPSTPQAEPTGDGTVDNPFNVSAALNYTTSLGSDVNSPNQVYIKGKISKITEEFGTQFGNGTFYISDDGTSSNEFYVFRTKYLGNKNYQSGQTQIKVGDDVIICGNVVNFRGNTPETVQNASYLYSLNGEVGEASEPQGEAKGTGTANDPFNVAAAIAKCKEIGTTVPSEKYYVKGIVMGNATADATYNNITFDIADAEDGATFKCYQVAGTDGNPLPQGFSVKKGDVVVVYGPIYNYSGNTPETAGKSAAYIVSINGQATGSGTTGPTQEVGTADNPVSVPTAYEVIEKLAEGATTDEYYYVKGYVTSIKTSESDIAKFKNIDYYISDAVAGSNYQIQVFRGKNLNNTDFTSADQLKVGDEVVVYGKLQKYKNNTTGEIVPEMTQGSYLVKHNGQGGTGTDDPTQGGGDDKQFGTLDGNVLTLTAADLGVGNGMEPGTITLVDGTTITFDGGGNNNKPKYYDSGASIRMYPKNSMTVNGGQKKIYGIDLYCSSQSGTLCNAEGNITVTGNAPLETADSKVSIYRIDNSSVTITNSHTGTGAASQLRFNKIVITYN